MVGMNRSYHETVSERYEYCEILQSDELTLFICSYSSIFLTQLQDEFYIILSKSQCEFLLVNSNIIRILLFYMCNSLRQYVIIHFTDL